MTVNMPVEVFNEKCIYCPDLEVDTITKANFIVQGVKADGTVDQKNEYKNELRCIHCQNCKIRYEAVFKKDEEPEVKVIVETCDKLPEKPKAHRTRKTTAKKPAAKPAPRKKQVSK